MALLAAVLVVARLALPSIAKRQIERRATRRLGLDVVVGAVDLSLHSMRATLRDVVVAAPEGFERREMLRAEEITVAFDPIDTRKSTLSVERIELKGAHACFERDPDLGASLRARAGESRGAESEDADQEAKPKSSRKTAAARTFAIESISLADCTVEWIDRKRSGRAPTARVSWSLLRSGRVVFRRGEELEKLTIFDGGIDDLAVAFDDGGTPREALRLQRASFTYGKDGYRDVLYLDAALRSVEWSTDADGKSEWEAMGDAIHNATNRRAEGIGKKKPAGDGKPKKESSRKRPPPTRDVDVAVALDSFVRRAVVDGAVRDEELRNLSLKVVLGEGETGSVAFSADLEDGRRALDLAVSGPHLFDATQPASAEGSIDLDGFPWHLLLWPRTEDDAKAAEDGALVRNVLVSGSVAFKTGAQGAAGNGSLSFSEIDARRDPRTAIARLIDGESSPATWLADLDARYSGSPPPLKFSFESEAPDASWLLLYANMAEAFARARMEAVATEE